MRRRLASAVTVAAVSAVAVAAIVDAVRPRAAPSLDAEAAAQLARLGVSGTLIYADAGCELHALSLPELKATHLPEGDAGCAFSASPDGHRVGPASVRWSVDGSERCGGICAWRGDERTFIRGSEIVAGGGVVVARSELERAARTHPNAPELPIDELRVLDLAWTSPDDVVALISAHYRLGLPEDQTTVAGFRNGRLRWQRPYFGGYDRLVISAGGDVLLEPAVRTQSPLFAGLEPSGPIDWSPDGRRLAVATRASVFVVDPAIQRRVRIPVTARDLAWR